MRARLLWLMAAAMAGFWVAPPGAGAQQLLSDPFSGATTSSPIVSLDSGAVAGFPCLTAGTDTTTTPVAGCNLVTPDPVGSGVLRLTDDDYGEAAGILYDGSFPTSAGLDITFDQYQYGSGGADGISFDLAVSPPQPTAIGQPGGSLGYGPGGSSPGSLPGLPGGYLGIGLDNWGNFSNTLSDGSGCTDPSWAGASANQVAVRGPGNGNVGYCLLSSSGDGSQTDLLGSDPTYQLSGADRPSSMLSVEIKIDPNLGTYTVGIEPPGNESYQTVTSGSLPTSYFDPATGNAVSGIPPRLTFAFAASTGAVYDVHEISNVTANTLNGSVPELTLTNTASSGTNATAGAPDTYSLLAGVSPTSPASESSPTSMQVTDPIPAGETLTGTPSGSGWDCSATTATLVSCTNTSTAPLAAGSSLPAVSVPVTIDSSATGQIVNTAQLISSDAASAVSGSATVSVSPPTTTTTTGTVTTAGTTPTLVPSVMAGPPSVSGQSAAFKAVVNPDGAATAVYFQYGLDPKYGLTTAANIYTSLTPSQVLPAGSAPQPVTATVPGLVPDALYHVRVVATNAAGTSVGADQTFTTAALPPPPAPVIGQAANFTPVSGTVYVKLPPGAVVAGFESNLRSSAIAALTKGIGFIPLTQARQLPVGTQVDARAGTLRLTTATTASTKGKNAKKAKTQSGDFSLGLFQVLQSEKRSQKGLTTLSLLDSGIFPGAPSYKTECAAVGKTVNLPGGVSRVFKKKRGLSSKVLQTLNASEHGNYQTRGRYSAATVRGTVYTVSDRCDGTLTVVKRGEVVVTDYRRPKKPVTLRAGRRYLAKAP